MSGAPAAGQPTLRVGVNLCWLVPGVVGGSEEYLVGSLLALAESGLADDRLEVVLFGLEALAETYPRLADAFRFVPLRLRGRLKPARVVAETTWLADRCRHLRLDVVHHGGGVLPLWSPGARVVTIHDVQPLAFPHYFSPVKRRWLAWNLPYAAGHADVIVTTSAFVADTVVQKLGAALERVRRVPPCLFPLADRPEPAPGMAARLGINGPYVVYPAITYPHKNHRVLVEAASSPSWPEDTSVVLTGGSGPAEAELARLIRDTDEARPAGRRVHRLGRVPRAELDGLLAEAAALAFPSTYEGFGMPALEAMAAGLPVVAARAGALPEVVSSAGVLVDPAKPEEWAQAVQQVVNEDAAAQARRCAAGRAQAATFSESRTAAALVEAWRAAAGRGSP